VSPGLLAGKLGEDFPSLSPIKLSYPNGSILADSIGDLLFSVTLNQPNITKEIKGVPNALSYSSVDIYIPPDFTGLTISQIWTSFTNNYDPNSLSLAKVASTDIIAPNWWRISVKDLIVTSNLNYARDKSGNLTINRVFVANRTQYIRVFQITSPQIAGRYFFKAFVNGTSIGAENFPTLVVKGTNDPGYISGTLRDDGNSNRSLFGLPISLPEGYGARIVAAGADYLGRAAYAQAFINSTANGRYTIFGVAPGTYTLTAYAAGFRPTTLAVEVTVHRTQSLEGIDFYLPHSVNITGTVLSLCSDGAPLPWGQVFGFNKNAQNRSISIRVLTPDGSVVAATPTPNKPALATNPSATSFDFSIQRFVGYDGRIPQDYANYTSGLPAGDYLLRAYVTQYVQFDEVRIHVSNETLLTFSEIRLIRGGIFNVTVHFNDLNSTLVEGPLPDGGALSIQAIDQNGVVRGSNTTFVQPGATSATIEIVGISGSRGFGISGLFAPDYGLTPGTYTIIAKLQSSPTFAGFANVGIRQLYYQIGEVKATVGLPTSDACSGPSSISLHLVKGGGLNFTLYSVDTENPHIPRPWVYPNSTIRISIIDYYREAIYQANATQRVNGNSINFFYAGLLSGDYGIIVKTVGYEQEGITNVHVELGSNSDLSIRMIQQPTIRITLLFKSENILTSVNSTLPYVQPINNIDATPVRFEVFDKYGNFVGANATYIPNRLDSASAQTTWANFTLAGFDRYYGDPMATWSGFYDTTDAVRQDEGGLAPGAHTIRIWVDGYYQTYPIQVNLTTRGESSLFVSVERASRISGLVVGTNYYDEPLVLSWAIVDLEPSNYTTFSLDGQFQLWVPGGEYRMGISLPGYLTQTGEMRVPWGSDITANFLLSYGLIGSSPSVSQAANLIYAALCPSSQRKVNFRIQYLEP